MFKDEVKVKFISGRGGNGRVKLIHTKIPIGGNGGKGGDIYVEGSKDISSLDFLDDGEIFRAEDGELGDIHNKRGKYGKDLIVKLPLGTEIRALNDNLILKIEKHGEQQLLLQGGEGGLGNYHFRDGKFENLRKYTPGKKGKDLNAKLLFKLKADVVFIGFPNAGKSSMLNALTNSHAKVGNYPFTTLSPNLGSLPGLKLMDLPGLIEGTQDGKGLGSGFLKHTESARLVAHLISLESEDLLKSYQLIRNEIESISKDLAEKKEIIVVTKSDLFSETEVEEKIQPLKNLNKRIVIASTYYPETVSGLEKVFREEL